MTKTTPYLTAADIVADGDALQTDLNGRNYIQWTTDTNVFVQAGAGSGKTTTLIQRLLTLIIDDGLRIDQIAAITFTEAAAAKLVADLRQALADVSDAGTHTPFPDAETTVFRKVPADEAKRRAAEALEGLPGASIGTLHSFCLRLLKLYPLEAGLPPQVDKVDELRQQMDAQLRADSVVDTLTRLVAADAGALRELGELAEQYQLRVEPAAVAEDLRFLLTNGASMRDFSERARWMDAHWGELGPTLTAPRWRPATEDEFKREWLDTLAALQAGYDASGAKPGDGLRTKIDAVVAGVQEHTDPTRATTGREPTAHAKPGNSGSAKDWAMADVSAAERMLERRGVDHSAWNNKKTAAELLKLCIAEMEGRETIQLTQAVDAVTPVLAALVMRDKDRRVRRGTLEYHDMVYLAQELVENPENGDILARLHEQFRVIVVDEFQDTDPAQYTIVRAIAAGSLTGVPTPGSLFVVGDPKQSIYRFRNADIDNYNLVRQSYSLDGAGEGVLLNLSQNFRSSSNVIAAVNAIFGEVFADDAPAGTGPAQAAYNDMLAQAVQEGIGPDGTTTPLPGTVILLRDDAGAAENPHAAEEADIVALIRAATRGDDPAFYYHQTEARKDADGNPIEGPGVARPLTYSDIAVLVPTNRDSRRILAALAKAGIPYVSEGSTRLFRVPELGDLLTVLRAVGDPADPYAQVAALRTALLGCSDAELAAARAGQPAPRVEEAREWLRETAKEARGKDAGAVVRGIVQDKHLRQAFMSPSRGSAVGSLDHFEALAEQFSQATGLGIREFVRWADEQGEDNNGASDPVLDNRAEGVRVMTIHKSKGLEFPMVIAAGLSAKGGNRRFSGGISRTEPKVAHIKLGAAQGPGYADLNDFDAEADKNELKRRLYVALTRAESVLAVPLQIPLTKQGAYASRPGTPLLKALDAARAGADGEQLAEVGLALRTRDTLGAPDEPLAPLGSGLPIPDLEAIASRRSDLRASLTKAAAVAPRISVTAIAHASERDAGEDAGVGAATKDAVASTSTGATVRRHLTEAGWVPQGEFPNVDARTERAALGTSFGSAVHEVMERLPDAGDATVAELARIAAAVNGVPEDRVDEVARVATAFAASEPYCNAIAAEHHFRELPVAGQVEGTAVNGYIDLLYKEGEHWVIADYKTDVYAHRSRVESYFTQLELYARLLGGALGGPVARLELIFSDGDAAQVVTHLRG